MDITVVTRSPPLIKLHAGITPPQAFNSNLFDAYFSVTVARSFFYRRLLILMPPSIRLST
jgi:hypothetical protein